MTTRVLPALALAALLGAPTARSAADDPKLPDVKAFDKLVVDALRDVHNKGADLYNTSKDFAGAYRMYQGALSTVRPLLAHRPDTQKLIETGLANAEKETDAARKAFVLHETIEAVRKDLKTAIGEKKPSDPPKKVTEEPKKAVNPPKKTEDKKDEPKKAVEPPKKVEEPKKVEPPKKAEEPKKVEPPAKKPADPSKDGAKASGVVTLNGKPLVEGELTLASTNQPKPRVFTTAIKDGKYQFAEAIPAGKYAAAITGKGVPAKYNAVDTSGLTVELAAGAATFDIVLK